MESKSRNIIIGIVLIGAVGTTIGILGFAGVFTPKYTLTIEQYEEDVTWLPANSGTVEGSNMTIQFKQGTNVTIIETGVDWFGADAGDLNIINSTHAWIIMDSDKVIRVGHT